MKRVMFVLGVAMATAVALGAPASAVDTTPDPGQSVQVQVPDVPPVKSPEVPEDPTDPEDPWGPCDVIDLCPHVCVRGRPYAPHDVCVLQ